MNYTTMVSLSLCSILVLTIWLSTSSVEAQECRSHLTGLEGSISSPVRSGVTQKNPLECEWTITVPPVYRIALKLSMSLQESSPGFCNQHWVVIESLVDFGDGIFHGIFCTSIKDGRTITSVQNRLRIKHHFDGYQYTNYQTFSLTYIAVPLQPAEVAKFYVENIGLKNEDLPKAVTSLALVDESYFKTGNAKAENIINRLRLQLGENLIRNSTRPMTAGDLALHISGLLAVCINPRASNGVDLVYHLRKLMDSTTGILNPYLYLTLCNAGDQITDNDVEQLTAVVENQKPEIFWLDYQALAVLSLVCIRDRELGYEVEKTLEKATAEIKNYQLEDGGFGSLQTTSLVIQALSSVEAKETDWNRTAAVNFINKAKFSNGSFASLQDLYAIAPIISGKTWLYLNATKCGFSEDDVGEIRTNLSKSIQLTYSVWIGDHIDVSSSVTMKAPKGTKFFDFMRLAADQNEKFKFKWINVKNSPQVYEIGGLSNDPSSGRYWTLYTGTHVINLEQYGKGLQDYVPEDGEMAVMWYKTLTVGH